jgi:23S rRNA (uracil1939-C5)-methyltransferase
VKHEARARIAHPVATATILDLSHDGRGVTQADGKVVFIDDVLPGERIEWSRRKRGRNFDEGRPERIVEASPDRVTPACAHFGICGGCVLQHLSHPRQIEFKQRQLTEALTRIGKVTPEQILPPLTAGAWSYRRRARLAAKWVAKKNRTVVGFRERGSAYVAELRRCEVLAPAVADLLEPLGTLIGAMSVRDRVPQIEVAIADNAVALVIRILKPLTPADTNLLEAFARHHNVEIYLQPGGYETVAPLTAPATLLEYALPQFDVKLNFEPTDFIQVNGELNKQLVARAVALLAPAAGERVLDLFCGLGNFSLPLARSGAEVVGVEGDAGLIARARANADRNGLVNARFFTANLADATFNEAAWANTSYDKVLLDPPRAGAIETLPLIGRCGARRVAYVSCHPGSLARDAGILVRDHGFRLTAAGIMDMFPHTAHVESIAVFAR